MSFSLSYRFRVQLVGHKADGTEATKLSQVVADQGLRIRVRKDPRSELLSQ